MIPFDHLSGILINFLPRRGERIGSINYCRGRAQAHQSFPTLRKPSRSQSVIHRGGDGESQVPRISLCRCTCGHTRQWKGEARGNTKARVTSLLLHPCSAELDPLFVSRHGMVLAFTARHLTSSSSFRSSLRDAAVSSYGRCREIPSLQPQ